MKHALWLLFIPALLAAPAWAQRAPLRTVVGVGATVGESPLDSVSGPVINADGVIAFSALSAGEGIVLDRHTIDADAPLQWALPPGHAIEVGGAASTYRLIGRTRLDDAHQIHVMVDGSEGDAPSRAYVRLADGAITPVAWDGMPTDGGPLAFERNERFDPVVSHDGRVAFVADGRLWISDGETPQAVAASEEAGGVFGRIIPRLFGQDGSIVFESEGPRPDGGRTDTLWAVGQDGGEPRLLLDRRLTVVASSTAGVFCAGSPFSSGSPTFTSLQCGSAGGVSQVGTRGRDTAMFFDMGGWHPLGRIVVSDRGAAFVGQQLLFDDDGMPMGFADTVALVRLDVGVMTAEPVLQIGDPVPGSEAWQVAEITGLANSPRGVLAVEARLTRGGGEPSAAILQQNPRGAFELVAVQGEVTEIDGRMQTIEGFGLGPDTDATLNTIPFTFQDIINDDAQLVFAAQVDGRSVILASYQTPRRPVADLVVGLDAVQGPEGTFTVNVELMNVGREPVNDYVLDVTFDTDVEARDVPEFCTLEGRRLRCNEEAITVLLEPSGLPVQLSLELALPGAAPISVIIAAEVSSSVEEAQPEDNQARLELFFSIVDVDLAITAEVDVDRSLLTLDVVNNGTEIATGLEVSLMPLLFAPGAELRIDHADCEASINPRCLHQADDLPPGRRHRITYSFDYPGVATDNAGYQLLARAESTHRDRFPGDNEVLINLDEHTAPSSAGGCRGGGCGVDDGGPSPQLWLVLVLLGAWRRLR